MNDRHTKKVLTLIAILTVSITFALLVPLLVDMSAWLLSFVVFLILFVSLAGSYLHFIKLTNIESSYKSTMIEQAESAMKLKELERVNLFKNHVLDT